MAEDMLTVAGDDMLPEMPADDAQAEEVSFEELAADLSAAKTAENTGDGDPAAQEQAEKPTANKSNQIRAALRSQRDQIFRDLGASEAEIRELIREKKAAEMAAADPEISPKAARKIIEAQENARGGMTMDDARNVIQQLSDDGWTTDELRSFVSDETVRERLERGESARRVATDFFRSGHKPQQAQSRRSVPITRNASTDVFNEADRIAGMSDDEFDRFSRRVDEALMAGRPISF